VIGWPARLIEPREPVVKMGSAENFPFEGPRAVDLFLDGRRPKFRVIFFMTDGKPGPELNLRPLFEAYHGEVSG
jgi:hypothetical protein